MPEYQTVIVNLTSAAGTDTRTYCGPSNVVSGEKWKVLKIAQLPNIAVATNGTDYVSIQAFKGASTAVSAARVTSSTGYTQGTPEDLAVSAVGADAEIDDSATGLLSLRVANSGSGKAVNFNFAVTFERVRV